MSMTTSPLASATPQSMPDTRNAASDRSGENSFAQVLDQHQANADAQPCAARSTQSQTQTQSQTTANANTNSSQNNNTSNSRSNDTSGDSSSSTSTNDSNANTQDSPAARPAVSDADLSALMMLPALMTTPVDTCAAQTPDTTAKTGGSATTTPSGDAKSETDTDTDVKLELAASFAGLLFTPQQPVQTQPIVAGGQNTNENDSDGANETQQQPNSVSTATVPAISGELAMLNALSAAIAQTATDKQKSAETSDAPKDVVNFSAALAQNTDTAPTAEPAAQNKKLNLDGMTPVAAAAVSQNENTDPARAQVKAAAAKENSRFSPEIIRATTDEKSVTRTGDAKAALGTAQAVSAAMRASRDSLAAAVARNNFPMDSFSSETDAATTAGDRTVVPTQNPQTSFASQIPDFSSAMADVTPAQHLVRSTLEAIPKPLAAMNIQIQPEGFGPIQVRVSAPVAGAANAYRVEIRTADPAARALLNDNLRELKGSLKTDSISVQPMNGKSDAGGANGANAGDEKFGGGREQRQNAFDPQRQQGKRSTQELFELFNEQK